MSRFLGRSAGHGAGRAATDSQDYPLPIPTSAAPDILQILLACIKQFPILHSDENYVYFQIAGEDLKNSKFVSSISQVESNMLMHQKKKKKSA